MCVIGVVRRESYFGYREGREMNAPRETSRRGMGQKQSKLSPARTAMRANL